MAMEELHCVKEAHGDDALEEDDADSESPEEDSKPAAQPSAQASDQDAIAAPHLTLTTKRTAL